MAPRTLISLKVLLNIARRWAGIANYIVATWDDPSLALCQALYLPCFNASAYLPIPLRFSMEEALFHTANFFPITWLKPMLTRWAGALRRSPITLWNLHVPYTPFAHSEKHALLRI